MEDGGEVTREEMSCVLVEVAYSALSDLIQEAKAMSAFVPLKADESSFLDSMGRLEGFPESHFFLLVRGDSEAVGFAAMLPHEEEETLSIGPVYVREEYQGQGLGRRLVEEIVSWAEDRGGKWLFTQTWGENVGSRRVLEGLGFEFVEEELNTRVNGDSTVQYVLELRSSAEGDRSSPVE
jgi:GNAT superfamily N-acetyltransferase